jgi:MmyB-like transcription regulator ligand binding domain
VAHDRGAGLLMEGLPEELLAPPLNVLRARVHPDGLAPRIGNLGQWKAHVMTRLGRQIALTGDPALVALLAELETYPAPPAPGHGPGQAIAVPLRLHTPQGELAFISTVATFGTAVEITASELAIESFFPADDATAAAVREHVGRLPQT